MKIGIAFSGSGIGAQAAWAFVDELQKCSVSIEMLSATSLAAVSTLLWAKGLGPEEIAELMTLFCKTESPLVGVRQFERMGVLKGKMSSNLSISSVDAATGVTMIYSDTLHSDAWNLKVLPLTGNEAEALAATLSPCGGLDPYASDGMRLCDFAVRYGCPFFPLTMAGMERLLSVSFAGGETPAQIAADSLSSLTCKNADLHYTIKLKNYADADIETQVRSYVRQHIAQIYERMLF